ncbi:MAG: glycosyltransferase [Elusimicrobiota bacterium]|nr:glycosyltransferase [Endomicrobiia bacterium]MDW8055347.1 glycosyltransferase [Elusimicrobiota bacterium]MDW8166444.1 glycosyltransferase [Elusimicrobiota bacterium]
MTDKVFLSVVIPVYNEEDCIVVSLQKIINYLQKRNLPSEIIIVDDGSIDNTKNLVEKFVKDNPSLNIKFLTRQHMGKGTAVRMGMLNSVGDYCLFLDADLSTDITEFDKMFPYIQQGIDVIIGSRRIRGAKIVIHQPFLREFMGRVFTWLSNIFLGTKFSDFTCGFKCFSKKAKDKIFSTQKINGWSFDSEILFLAKKFGFKIQEIPVTWYNDPSTNVKLLKDTILSFIELIKITVLHKSKRIIILPFILLCIILGFWLRTSCINFGLPSKNLALTTYNPDEPIVFWSIEKWEPKKLNFHPYGGFFWGGFHLYVTAGGLAIGKILGYVKFGNRDFYINNLKEADKLYKTGRFILIIFGSISAVVIFLILKECYSDKLALIGMFLLSVLPAHVFNSVYIRPDVLMMFFGLLSMYFSVKIIKEDETKYYLLSAVFVGVSAATKYSGGIFLICPVLAHFLVNKKFIKKVVDYRLYLVLLFFVISFLFVSPYVILDFNKTQDSFLRYIKHNLSMAKGAMNFDQYILYGKGVISYFGYYLKYGLGKVMILCCLLGIVLMCINTIVKKNKFDLYFLISGLIVLAVISNTKTQALWYIFPFVPFAVVYSIRGLELLYYHKKIILKFLSVFIIVILVSYTFIYTIAYWKLYKHKNVREEASEWILKNIPLRSKIAIARSYFWTPPVLRQYNPPYEVLMGADPVSSSVQEGVLGLEKLLDETEYVVLTEYEYRWAVHPKLRKYFSKHAEIIDRIFNSGEFVKLAEFDKQAKFLWFTFKKNYPPGDWLIPNPKIVVYKKV